MIYIDKDFRFYDDSADHKTFPELKPVVGAVPLSDDEVKEITSNISLWKWHPIDNIPYKIPDIDSKYLTEKDGIIIEMTEQEKDAVDAKEAEIAQQEAEINESQKQKEKDIVENLPSWKEVSDAIDGVTTIAGLKGVVKKLARVVYWLAKNKAE